MRTEKTPKLGLSNIKFFVIVANFEYWKYSFFFGQIYYICKCVNIYIINILNVKNNKMRYNNK